jgi:CBS domain containing-hemolysin-like protein
MAFDDHGTPFLLSVFQYDMGIFLLGLLLYCFVLLAESALVALTPQEAEQLRTDPAASAQRAYGLFRDIRPAMAALLLARILLKLLLLVYAAAWCIRWPALREALYALSFRTGIAPEIVWILAALLFAALCAVLFRGLHKANVYGLSGGRAVLLLRGLAWMVLFFKKLFAPFIRREQHAAENNAPTPAEDQAIAGTATSSSEKRELELLKSIVKFGDVTVKQVMQPRSKVVAIDFRSNFHELLETVREAEFSRFPVYDEDLDNVTGILYVKDLVPHIDKPADFEWQSLIRTNLMLAPESKRGAELLKEFKQQKIHMAVVVDEYGGSSGIVTLEDILEEVTGDIRDEFDEESEVRYRKLDDHNYLFEGQTLLNDVCRITGLEASIFDPVRGNADTLAGLALELKGDIPKAGTEIGWNDFLLTVIAADNRRIGQLKLTLPR